MEYQGDYPKFEELNDATCQERSIKIHYPEFHEYLIKNYAAYEKWGEKLALFYNNLKESPKCPVCGKPCKFLSLRRGWTTACSRRCVGHNPETMDKKRKTCIKKFGYDNAFKSPEIQEKAKKTCLERYGVENPYASEEVKQKIKQHNIEKYGGNSPMCSKEAQKKSKKTCLERYGVEYSSQNEQVKEASKKTCLERYGGIGWDSKELMSKFRKTCLEKYGVEYISQNEHIKQKAIETNRKNTIAKFDNILDVYLDKDTGMWVYICKCPHPECNKCKDKKYVIKSQHYWNRKTHNTELCTILQPISEISSSLEKIVRLWLDESGIEYFTNVRDVIYPKELDIYIPSKKVAIEINGCYWHSDKEKSNNYHVDKFKACSGHDIQLIQIWEDWLVHKPEIVKSFLLSKLGCCENTIYARETKLREVSNKETIEFLEENHIQGRCNSKYSYGLYYNDELVSLMTFGYNRGSISKNSKNQSSSKYELLRFCTKLNTRVVGGASKLLKHFIEINHPTQIISYASCDISNGNLYKSLGFETDNKITKSYWYIDPNTFKRYHRASFTKSSIIKKGIKESKGSWTETEAMDEAGYIRIYDAGQMKWVKNM